MHYSTLFLPKSMKENSSWDYKRLVGLPKSDWLYNKIQVFSYEPDGTSYSHIYKNIALYKNILDAMPYGGESLGSAKADFHEFRIYGLVGQDRDSLPNFYEQSDISVLKGINFHVSYDIPFILASLSMNEQMYGPKCTLIGWSISKFNEGKLKDRASVTFYIKGDRQILYNELKWLLLDECNRFYPDLNIHNKFAFVKKCIPEDAIFYNIVYDREKMLCLIESDECSFAEQFKNNEREKKDISNAIVYATKNSKDHIGINILRKIIQ